MSFKFFEDSRGEYVASPAEAGELPKIFVSAEIYPAAYELAILALNKHGTRSRTHYDKRDTDGNYLHPPSIEANVAVEVRNPLKEPRGHLMIPGDYRSLESYRQEVVDGIHDCWIEPGTPKWTYTYHKRLTDWNPSTNLNASDGGVLLPRGVNQIDLIVQDLVRDVTSKGAQATTWMPTADPGLEGDRPCFQRIWIRAYEVDKEIHLNANWYFRSRDATAWFMNNHGFIDLVAGKIAPKLADATGLPVKVRRIKDESDSLHIYGKDQEMFNSYVQRIKTDVGFKERALRTDRSESPQEEFFQEEIAAEREALARNPHHSLSLDSQRHLAERLASGIRDNPYLISDRDKKFVEDFFPEFISQLLFLN